VRAALLPVGNPSSWRFASMEDAPPRGFLLTLSALVLQRSRPIGDLGRTPHPSVERSRSRESKPAGGNDGSAMKIEHKTAILWSDYL
jgi:hypothetical protein